ncbi:DNA-binding transcription factor yap1 [Diaporthe australafricana]|uniref:DNA-binding transcription factor yap1 n=1 Tax=Diaporthe australafricana TaxID=127596 RepID=A0ABR3XJG1_9PEZI
MASSGNPHDFVLTPQQQSLLFAALNSNKQPTTASPMAGNLHMSPASFGNSPTQKTDVNGFDASPFLDYDYDINGDTSFDFSFADGSNAKMIGDLPGSAGSDKSGSENNDTEKRSHPDDENDDEGGDTKRQETGEKVSKKPGRKPLTTEPTSKRKAQNRAAQRAFRERKEQHLKTLETKVEELEKASAQSNHENSVLRAQVEKMTTELGEYKKRLSSMVNTRPASLSGGGPRPTFGNAVINNLNDVNFQFEFPKFGQLPGPSPTTSNQASTNGRTSNSQSPRNNRSSSEQTSPLAQSARHGSTGSKSTNGLDAQTQEDLANFSGIFSPPLTNNNVASAARGRAESHNSGAATNTSSPSASSNSHGGPSSSCGTSPEPFTQSPMGFKPVDTLTTIGEEKHPLGNMHQDFSQFANIDVNDMNFMSSTNNFQFDPQLFGGYREPQENILGNGFDDTFFNDAFDVDFTTPYFAPSPAQKKDDLMSRIDAAKNDDATELVQTSDGQLLTCNKIWEKLQSCPRVQNGDFDLDGLCSDLQKKAKCSGSGAVVDESTFKKVMQKYLGKTDKEMEEGCPDKLKFEQQAQQLSA